MVPLAVQLHWSDVARMDVHIQFIIFWESMSRRSLFLGVEGVTLSISKTYSIDSIKNIIVNPIPSFIFFTSFLRLYLHNGCEWWEKREGERKGRERERERKR